MRSEQQSARVVLHCKARAGVCPAAPPPEARARMLQAEDIAECIWFALSLPARANVEEILVRPSRPWTG